MKQLTNDAKGEGIAMNPEGERLAKVLSLAAKDKVCVPEVMGAVAECVLGERKRVSDLCTDGKIRKDTPMSDWDAGWNAACRELCNAIANHRKPRPGVRD